MARLERGETLSQRAQHTIRQAIRDGTLVHGAVYSENELGTSMGVSRTPVREALIDLAREGIVDILPQRGFKLREFTPAERDEIFDLRRALESLVFERLARHRAHEAAAELGRILEAQREASDDPVRFLELDEQFHLVGAQLLGMERTYDMLRALRGAMWLLGAEALGAGNRTKQVLLEHERVLHAIEAGDVRAVRRALREHLSNTAAAVGPT